ncbi:MAG: hypothetical protein D6702_12165 [Planctomycetota bacterium]|nr:MAG: hypothetical protein D6702_12165 [Planctomycetota bacterium]
MSDVAASALEEIPAPRRARLLAAVRRWQRRSGLAAGRPPAEVLGECLGEVWLARRGGLGWDRALRRALYREFEQPRLRTGCDPAEVLPAPPDPRPVELPPWCAAWLLELSARPTTSRCPVGGSRRRSRLILTEIALALSGGQLWLDLERRCARLLARATTAPPGDRTIRRRARELHRLLGRLELPPRLQHARSELTALLGRRPPAAQKYSGGSNGGRSSGKSGTRQRV